jgi:hypothetical protein
MRRYAYRCIPPLLSSLHADSNQRDTRFVLRICTYGYIRVHSYKRIAEKAKVADVQPLMELFRQTGVTGAGTNGVSAFSCALNERVLACLASLNNSNLRYCKRCNLSLAGCPRGTHDELELIIAQQSFFAQLADINEIRYEIYKEEQKIIKAQKRITELREMLSKLEE